MYRFDWVSEPAGGNSGGILRLLNSQLVGDETMNRWSRFAKNGGLFICCSMAAALLLTGCGSYKDGQSVDESDAVTRRLNELERKQDTQGARLNQMIYGIEDSLAVWRQSAAGGAAGVGRYDIFMKNEIYFELNEYKIDDAARTILDEFAMRLAEHPGAYIQISGHADMTGDAYYNLQLSQQRAEAAVRYLTRQWDVPLNRIERLGFGEEDQAYPEDTAIGKNRNRRLELQLRVPAQSKRNSDLP